MEENKSKLEEGKDFVSSKIQQYIYYGIIGTISFVALVFLPMVGTAELGWNLPTDSAGWVVWLTTKALAAVINVLIFHSFIQQARVNIKDNPRYLEARKMLYTCKPKNYTPRSPAKFLSKQYGFKGVSIFLITGLSTVALTMAFLYFNWTVFLAYLFTIVMGVVLGLLEMLKVQDYWTNEFYDFALGKVREKEESESVKVPQLSEVVEEPQKEEIVCSNLETKSEETYKNK